MDMFMSLLNSTIAGNKTAKQELRKTENGAVGYSTTRHKLLDVNFALASYRNKDEATITTDFLAAYREDPELALKFLFYARDVLEGAGERRYFRTVVKSLANSGNFPAHLVKYIPEYGRWDDVFALMDTSLEVEAMDLIRAQLVKDMKNDLEGKSISLLAKWMPSINTSSANTRALANKIRVALGVPPRSYRKMLAKLRAKIDVVERKLCANEWDKVKYENVPSKANALYKDAFLAHDYERRVGFLGDVVKGEKTIKATTLAPHDIIHKYMNNGWRNIVKSLDVTLEELWKALPNHATPMNTLVVADGSGSMTSTIGNTNVSALDVANALAIYFAERATGQYKNKYITFSHDPQYVDFSKCKTLHDKITKALEHDECANTNVEAVFDLILTTAVQNRLAASELPQNIVIVSDMEFDSCVVSNAGGSYWSRASIDATLFGKIAKRYAQYGYKLPKLVFWNVNSRTGTIPMRENENGVVLVSGFTPAIMKMVMNNETDPYAALVRTLNDERYAKITLKA